LELGDVRPSFARRLVALLDQRGRRADVDRVMGVLRDQGTALAEATMVQAFDAIRAGDYDRGVALARQLFPESSSASADHLELGRVYLAAGRNAEAGREFRRAVDLGRGVPENWLAYVRFLVQIAKPDQARAAMNDARNALPADRAAAVLAQC